MIELELLETGIGGKRKLWTALGRALGSSFEKFDFEELAARADAQRSTLESHHLEVAAEALAGEPIAPA